MAKPQQKEDPKEGVVAVTQDNIKIKSAVAKAKRYAPSAKQIIEQHQKDRGVRMSISDKISRSENSYKWLNIAKFESDLFTNGGIWTLVTRSNHSHIPEHFFGLDGAITYKNQNILAYCRREATDAINKEVAQSFNKRTELSKKPEKKNNIAFVEETDYSKEEPVTSVDYSLTEPIDN